jgi:putative transposase
VKAVELAKITQNSGKKNPNLLLIVAGLDLHHRSPAHHLLDAEADRLCNAQRQERSEARRDSRAWHYERKLQTKAGEVAAANVRDSDHRTLSAARELSRGSAHREVSGRGVSVRRVEDITEALWGTGILPSTVSDLNKKIYGTIEAWRNRPIESEHPYVYLDGIVLKRARSATCRDRGE